MASRISVLHLTTISWCCQTNREARPTIRSARPLDLIGPPARISQIQQKTIYRNPSGGAADARTASPCGTAGRRTEPCPDAQPNKRRREGVGQRCRLCTSLPHKPSTTQTLTNPPMSRRLTPPPHPTRQEAREPLQHLPRLLRVLNLRQTLNRANRIARAEVDQLHALSSTGPPRGYPPRPSGS